MTLLVDIGNTRFKWARLREGRLGEHGAGAYRPERVGEFLDARWGVIPPPGRVLGCNVGGREAERAVARWVARHWRVPCAFVAAAARGFGVANAYAEPATMGPDRWAALVAARARLGVPACIVDCGSALTVDLVDGEGVHRGGVIAPGLGLMRQVLAERTRRVGRVAESGPAPWLGRSTPEAVAAGTLHALVGAVEQVRARALSELGCAPDCLLTGGDARWIRGRLAGVVRHEPDLVLQGLAVMAEAAA